jgi:ATP-dependent Clp protease ATP-binding subunit ClpB
VGSFLFLGPTGVGKTELARALAATLFDDQAALVRLDGSELAERHAAARLVGAPPGYVGHEEGGQLTEAVRRRPFAVVLFDELDKAHPAVGDLLLQLLDGARLTDGTGRTVRFADALVVLTANLDLPAARARFRPELLGRLDEIVLFEPLGEAELRRIARLEVERVRRRAAQQGISLAVDEGALGLLAGAGASAALGARPLRRAIERLVEEPLAARMVAGELQPGDRVEIGSDGEELTVTCALL